MDNFDLRKYLAEGRLLENEGEPTYFYPDDPTDIDSDYGTHTDYGIRDKISDRLKKDHPGIYEKTHGGGSEVSDEFFYNFETTDKYFIDQAGKTPKKELAVYDKQYVAKFIELLVNKFTKQQSLF